MQTRPRGAISRRTFLTATGSALALGSLAACGDGGAADPSQGQGAAGFPVTVRHSLGETQIPAPPTRVVTVGLTDQDAFLGLGVVPVGITEWQGDYPSAVGPWARDRLGDGSAEIVGDAATINVEKIATLRPDVIVALYAGLTAEQYGQLSRIAPTVAQPGEGFSIRWPDQTRTAGQILGRQAEADALVRSTEDAFTRARQANPQFEGRTAVFSVPADQGTYGVYSEQSPFQAPLTALGFTVPPGVRAAIPAGAASGTISEEELGVFDEADLIVWNVTAESRAQIEASPVYRNSQVRNRAIFLTDTDTPPLSYALASSTVLSLPYLVDGLVPQLQRIVAAR